MVDANCWLEWKLTPQNLIHSYRFESCPGYYGLVSTIQRIEEVQYSQVAELVDAPNEGKILSRVYRFESCPDYKIKVGIMNY